MRVCVVNKDGRYQRKLIFAAIFWNHERLTAKSLFVCIQITFIGLYLGF